MKKVAVVLSGCGHRDGSEVTEAVSTLISLCEFGAELSCFAPNTSFLSTTHSSISVTAQERNSLEEAARIARGKIDDIKSLRVQDFDSLVFPGGTGAAKILSDWAAKGSKCQVHSEVARVITDFHSNAKPIGAICIAPVLLAKTLGSHGVTVTIGNDRETAQEIEKTGAKHAVCSVRDYVSDRDHKVLTTPAYMLTANSHDIFVGIRNMVRELVEMS